MKLPPIRCTPSAATLEDISIEHVSQRPRRGLVPFAPGRVPVYYGWIAMAMGALGILFSIPGQTMGVSVFTDSLIEALAMDRVALSMAYMVGTLTSAVLMTRAGRLTDRIGVRPASAASAAFLALFLVYLSHADRVAAWIRPLFGGRVLPSAFVVASVGFLGIRFFGQGVLTLASRTMVMRWFESRRGRVSAYMGVFVSAGFSFAPRLFQYLIDGRGWRGAWQVLALGLVAAAFPLILIFFRDSPESCDMTMEQGLREPKASRRRKGTASGDGVDATLEQARRQWPYWAYAFVLAWWSLYNTAFTFHVVDIFAERGVGAAAAVSIFVPVTVLTVTFNFLGSWASDLLDLPPFYFLSVLGMAVAGAAMMFPGAPWSRPVLILGLGLAGGLWNVLNTVAMPRLYGRRHLGTISGSVMTFLVAGSALGPWMFSLLHKVTGSYAASGVLGLVGPAFLGLLGLVAFRKRTNPST